LKERGYCVSICCLYDQLEIAGRFRNEGIEIIDLGMKGIWDLRGISRLWRILKKGCYDIVHAYLFDAGIYATGIARIAGIKAVLTSRRNYDDWMRLPHIVLQKIANLFTDKVIVNAESLKRLVVKQEGFNPGNILTIYNSIEKEKFGIRISEYDKINIKKELGIGPEEYMVLCVAKFKISKGHIFLLEAVKKVSKKFPRVKFVLIGKGPEQENVKAKVQNLGLTDNVIFAGQKDDITGILQAADICVLSSIREGFANTILEYMSSGKAVVATDVGGNSEIISSGENGVLVPKGDITSFSQEIIALLEDKDRRAELGTRAKGRIDDITFEPEYMVERFNAVYRELLNIKTVKDGLILRLKRRLLPINNFVRNTWTGSRKIRNRFVINESPERVAISKNQAKRSEKGKQNVIIVSIDPLRQDHLGIYGYRRNTTPNIDDFAKKCAIFTNAYSQAPWTTPAHMSLFTSLYPSFHGVDQPMSDTMRRLGKDKKTLAEYLKEERYLTAAFTGSGSISGQWGFSRGFDIYDETSSDEVEPKGCDISVIYNKAVDWIKTNKSENFFLFFHTYNTHTPYNDRYFVDKEKIRKNAKNEYLKALYDGDIRTTDSYLGNLITVLKNEGLLKNTVVILISDHGEDFSEHYPFEMTKGHGHSLYEELLRIPLIIYHPLFHGKASFIDKNVRLIDIMPTILDILGLSIPGDIQGKSLLPLLKGEDVEMPEYFFAEAICHGPERKMIHNGRYKYIYSPEPNVQKTGRKIYPVKMHELYDVQKDPGEKNNIYYKEKEIAKHMHEKLSKFIKRSKNKNVFTKNRFKVEEKLKQRLKSLGYIE